LQQQQQQQQLPAAAGALLLGHVGRARDVLRQIRSTARTLPGVLLQQLPGGLQEQPPLDGGRGGAMRGSAGRSSGSSQGQLLYRLWIPEAAGMGDEWHAAVAVPAGLGAEWGQGRVAAAGGAASADEW
jgi:hypothetical protein